LSEYFYIVDENDNVIGKATREECHSNPELIHRSVYVFVLNRKGEIFIQRRSLKKDLYPGFYTASPLRRLGKVKSFSKTEREISMIYICRYDGPIRFDRKEISEGLFMSVEDIQRCLKTGEKKFAYGFKVAFEELSRHLQDILKRDKR